MAWLPISGLVACAVVSFARAVPRSLVLLGLLRAEDPWFYQPSRLLQVGELGLGLVGAALFALTAAAWLVWQARAYDQMMQLPRASWSSSPKAVVGWWFVPVANLVMPLRLLQELWRNAPDERPTDERPALLRGWWALFLACHALWMLGFLIPGDQASMLVLEAVVELLTSLCRAAASLLAVLVVLRLDARLR